MNLLDKSAKNRFMHTWHTLFFKYIPGEVADDWVVRAGFSVTWMFCHAIWRSWVQTGWVEVGMRSTSVQVVLEPKINKFHNQHTWVMDIVLGLVTLDVFRTHSKKWKNRFFNKNHLLSKCNNEGIPLFAFLGFAPGLAAPHTWLVLLRHVDRLLHRFCMGWRVPTLRGCNLADPVWPLLHPYVFQSSSHGMDGGVEMPVVSHSLLIVVSYPDFLFGTI